MVNFRSGEPYFELKLLPIEEYTDAWDYYYYEIDEEDPSEYTGKRYVIMELSIKGCDTVNGAAIYLQYDTSLLTPKEERNFGSNKKPDWRMVDPTKVVDWASGYWTTTAVDELDTSNGWIGYEGADTQFITPGEVIATFIFELADDKTIDDITKDSIGLHAGYKTMYPEGITIPYEHSTKEAKGKHNFVYEGFPEEEEKKVTGITVTQQMDKTDYYDGEDLDFTGAEIEIAYEGGTNEKMPLKDAIEKGLVTVDQQQAEANNSDVTITGGDGITAKLEYRVAVEIEITIDPYDTKYEHGEALDFTGGVVTIKYDDNSTDTKNIPDGIADGTFIPEKQTAEAGDTEVILNYKDGQLSDEFGITVYDPIDKIEVVNPPSDIDYNHNESINPQGGRLKITRKSGAIEFVEMTDSSKVTLDPTDANIDLCDNQQQKSDGTYTGQQKIKAKYKETDEDGQQVEKEAEFEILVNDTISAIQVIHQPTANNKYGTAKDELDLTGAQLEITTESGKTFNVDITAGMLDDSYNSNILDNQNLKVTYAGKETSSGAGVDIQLKDYVESIEIQVSSSLEEFYNTDIEDVDFTKVKYIEKFAGPTQDSEPKGITKEMVQGYEKQPAASLFNAQHKCTEHLTLNVEASDVFKTKLTGTFDITIKDVITGIKIEHKPNITNYKYEEEFKPAGGKIKFYYESGAEDTSTGISMNDSNVQIVTADGSALDLHSMKPSTDKFIDGRATITLQVKYTDEQSKIHEGYTDKSGAEHKATFDITIEDILDKIVINGTPKKDFEYGDDFTLGDGVTLEVQYKSGKKKNVTLEDITIVEDPSGSEFTTSPGQDAFDSEPDNILDKRIKLEYGEGDLNVETTPYDITIKDVVDHIEVTTDPTKKDYSVNDNSWDLADGEVTLTRKSGRLEVLDLNETNFTIQSITEITDSAGDNKPVEVKYTDPLNTKEHKTTFEVNVKDTVTSIDITKDADFQDKYNHGEAIDYSKIKIHVHHSSDLPGAEGELVTVEPNMVTDITNGGSVTPPTTTLNSSDYDSGTHIAKRKLKIHYDRDGQSGDLEVDIEVYNILDHIDIDPNNEPKDSYVVHEQPKYPDGKIRIYRAADTSTPTDEDVPIQQSMVSDLDTDVPGTSKKAKVKYSENDAKGTPIEREVQYDYEVVDALQSVEISGDMTKKAYEWGEGLDLSGLIFTQHFASQDVTVNYDDIKAKVEIKDITEPSAEKDFDTTLEFAQSEFEHNDTITKRIKIIYKESESIKDEEEIEITITDKVKEIHMGTNPDKTKYNLNDDTWNLDATSGEQGKADIVVTYQSGRSKTIPITESMLPTLSSLTATANDHVQVEVQYEGKTTNFEISVVNGVTGITLDVSNAKDKYNWGEMLDFSAIDLYVKRAGDAPGSQGTKVEVNSSMVKDITESPTEVEATTQLAKEKFTSGYIATRTLKVSYEVEGQKKEETYTIEVYNIVDHIKIKESDKPKENYTIGESQPAQDGKIEIYRKADTSYVAEEKDITPDIVTGIETSAVKVQAEATVTYKETDAYDAEVKAEVKYKYNVIDELTAVKVENKPSKLDYNWGDTLDLSGIEITNVFKSGDHPVDDISSVESLLTIEEVKDGGITSALDKVLEIDEAEFASSDTITKHVKVTYTFQGKSASVQFDITITDNMESIAMGTSPDKLKYQLNESAWDLTAKADVEDQAADIIVTYQSGRTKTVKLETTMLSPDISDLTSAVGQHKEVTVTYGQDKDHQDLTTEFYIDVEDGISSIVIDTSAFTKNEYNYGEEVDLSQITITVNYAGGTNQSVDIDQAEIKDITDEHDIGEEVTTELAESDFGPDHTAQRTIRIKYSPDGGVHTQTATVTIKVFNIVDHIVITDKPQEEYNLGDPTTNAGGEIAIYRKANKDVSSEQENIEDAWISGLSTTTPGQYQATVKYTEQGARSENVEATATYNYKVKDTIDSQEITGDIETEYEYGDDLDLSGLELKTDYGSGSTQNTPIDESKLEIKDITDGTPKDLDRPLKPSKEEFENSPDHKVHKKVQITYTDDEGNETTREVDITISDVIEKIEMLHEPDDKTYNVNETSWKLDATDGTNGKADIKVTYKSGRTETVEIKENMLSPDLNTLTSSTGSGKTVTVTYEEQTTNFQIDVEDGITNVTIEGDLADTRFNYGETVDFSALSIKVEHASGNDSTINISQATIKDVTDGEPGIDVTTELAEDKFQGPEHTATRQIKITYEAEDGQKAEKQIEITVKNIIDHITIDSNNPPTYDYDLHAQITYPVGKILVYRKANTTQSTEQKEIEETMVSGLSTATAGKNKTATVTYKENDAREQELQEQTTYQYNVNDKLNGVTVDGTPTKDHYDYGDELELDGLTIQSNYESGNVDVDFKDENITITDVTDPAHPKPLDMTPDASEFDSNDEVKKKVKVEYEEDGQKDEVEFEITIKNNKVSIEMHEYPEDINYNVNDSVYKLDAASGKGTDGKADIKVTYQAGNSKIVALNASGVELTELSTLTKTTGQKTVEVKYGQDKEGHDLTTEFTINVEDGVTGVEIEGNLLNTAYNYAEPLNYNGVTIYVKHGSDAPGSKGTVVNISQAKITDITDGESSAPDATTSLPANKFDNLTHIAERTIRIYYKADAEHEDYADFTITVLNTLDHIEIANSPKTSYQLDDPTTGAGGTIKIYRSADTAHSDEVKAIEDEWITNLATNEIGTFEATVTYKEQDAHQKTITKTTNYNYTVSDTVLKIELDPEPTKKDYLYGDKLDLRGGKLKVTKANGNVIEIDLTDLPEGSITGFNGSPDPDTVTFPDEQEITITYGNYANGDPATVTFTVTVDDYVKDILLTPPTKKEYQYGERQLDLTGGSVQAVMASGKTTTPVDLDDSSVTLSQFDPEAIGPQEIEVTYEGKTKSFFVTIKDDIVSIKIKETPKQDYKYGEKLDVKGGTIEVTTKSGRVQEIPITESMVTGYAPNKLGPQELTVTYEGQTTTYTVEVEDAIASIEIVKPNKLVYNVGETMNLAGGKVIVIMASGVKKSPIDMTADMITGFDTSTEGAKRITVTYEGMKATFNITVVDPLKSITSRQPKKDEYLYGEPLDLTGGAIVFTKESGAKREIPMDESMVSGYNPNKLGTQTLTVTYEGQFVGTFDVEVKDYVSKLIVTPPSKTKYEYGENIDLEGGYVSIVMASGAVEEKVPMTSSMISGYNSTKEGIQNIQVEYKGLQGSFQVTVVDEIKGIEMNTNPDKVDYKYGQKLNVAGATIKVHKSSGTYIVSVTDDMVSGYNAKQSGTQSITVKYAGFTTNFAVTVAKKPASTTKPSNPKPSTPEVQEPTVQEPTVQEPQVQEPEVQKPTVQEPEKPTEVLGVQDENKGDSGKVLAGCLCILGLLFLLILIVFKRNVKVYVFEDGEYVLGGRDKITKKDPSLDIDKFLDGDTYANPVKIVLSDSISEKLDGKVIEIKHRGKTIKHTVKYNDEEYEFILE